MDKGFGVIILCGLPDLLRIVTLISKPLVVGVV